MELDEPATRDAALVLTGLVDDWTPDRTLSRTEIEAVAYAARILRVLDDPAHTSAEQFAANPKKAAAFLRCFKSSNDR